MKLTPDEILTPQERLNLIEQLWDSLAESEVPLTGAQKSELERRLATFDIDRAQALTWGSLKDELAQR